MPELFSDDFMVDFGNAWNDDEIGEALAKIGFNSTIGYGFEGDDKPKGYLKVENGFVTEAGAYQDAALNWDLRAKPADWEKWCQKGVSMMSLGLAYTSGKLKFLTGDYTAMIKNPAMAGPFIKSFAVMGRVPRT
ncbi:hypothetical protein RGUI_2707 [Rhodovulum sp. P5]|uniref:SCP-2 sterol transfer family protein n=1 Tax=Rhodovulum sp. P5 TaxID=1564506 RepID=UPI0009C38615|nr:SCP-2 sterol transfer family protein [Rhodovulum sp. P5]ARE40848.1 hypothetical protein RGUI_2707 [Rhodovulum sp. P5]